MKRILKEKFEKIAEQAEKYNIENKIVRFYPMTQLRYGKLQTIGLYDYKTKKYVLTDTQGPDVASAITEMEQMVENSHVERRYSKE